MTLACDPGYGLLYQLNGLILEAKTLRYWLGFSMLSASFRKILGAIILMTPTQLFAEPIKLVCSGSARFYTQEISEASLTDIAVELDLTQRTVKGIPGYLGLIISRADDAEVIFFGSYTGQDNLPREAFGTISRASGRLTFFVKKQNSTHMDTYFEMTCRPLRQLF